LLLFSRVGIANFSKKKMLQNKEKSKEAKIRKRLQSKEELNCFGNSMVV